MDGPDEPGSMEAGAALAAYLRTATVLDVRPLPGGGGHARKRVVIFEGGVGAVAKYGDDVSGSKAPAMIRAEAAAYALAVELGWQDLVPTTVLRTLDDPDDLDAEVEASVQVLLPLFKTSLEGGLMAASCEETDRLRAAAFDVLCANTDRNNGNWGKIDGVGGPRLIDHGHAFEVHGGPPGGDFVQSTTGATLPEAVCDDLQAFVEQEWTSELPGLVGGKAPGVFARARLLIANRRLSAP